MPVTHSSSYAYRKKTCSSITNVISFWLCQSNLPFLLDYHVIQECIWNLSHLPNVVLENSVHTIILKKFYRETNIFHALHPLYSLTPCTHQKIRTIRSSITEHKHLNGLQGHIRTPPSFSHKPKKTHDSIPSVRIKKLISSKARWQWKHHTHQEPSFENYKGTAFEPKKRDENGH